jgi:hypothetical protein
MLCKTVNKLDARQQRLYDKAVKELFPKPQEFAVSWYCFAYVGNKHVGNKPVGVVAYLLHEGQCYLNVVYTLKTYRKQGALRDMLRRVLADNPVLQWYAGADAVQAYLNVGAKVYGCCYMYIRKKDLK